MPSRNTRSQKRRKVRHKERIEQRKDEVLYDESRVVPETSRGQVLGLTENSFTFPKMKTNQNVFQKMYAVIFNINK